VTVRCRHPRAAVCLVGVALAACAGRVPAHLPASSPVADPLGGPVAVPTPQVDPVEALLGAADEALAEADRQVQQGRLDAAASTLRRVLADLTDAAQPLAGRARVRAYAEAVSSRLVDVERAAAAEQTSTRPAEGELAALDAILDAAALLPTPEPTLEELVLATLARAAPDLVVPVNPKVLSYVELFRTRLREWFAESLRRGGRYLPMIQRVFRAEGLPLDLAYVALVESAFKPTAVSRARAKGVWQFVRDTARAHGLKEDWYLDERADPEKATRAAARYLKTLAGLFGGDWLLALASYNGGPGRIERAIARSGKRDFWALAATPRLLPRETREYVPMILAAIVIAKAPTAFGFAVEPDPPIVYETVALPQPVDLRRVAAWIGTSFEQLLELNPELRRWMTPVRHPDYELKVPLGSADLLRARLALAADEEIQPFDRHVVRRGETLASIARKLRVSRADLAAANHLAVHARVRVGQALIVPRPPALDRVARRDTSAPRRPALPRLAGGGMDDDPGTEPMRILHHVKPGDTLAALARLYGTTVRDLQRWNDLPTTRIVAGTRLVVYASRAAAAGQN
jgi:membrane-bound lytic murein transglycosylase D